MTDRPAPDLVTTKAVLPSGEDRRSYDDTLHCNRCGFCTSFCPTYLATGDEALSPRARNQSFRALLENRLDPADAKRSFDTCLLCGICTSVCFAQVPTAKLMSAAREKNREFLGAPLLARWVVRGLLPRPRLFETVLRWAYAPKRWGWSGLLARWGVLKALSPRLAAAEALVEEVPARFLREELSPAPAGADVVQFIACGPNVVLPDVGRATGRLLAAAGARAGAAPNVCCGLPGLSLGDREGARALARKNIEILERYPRAIVLVDDSSCAATIKEYPGLFPNDAPWRERAEALRSRTRDLLEWLSRAGALSPETKGPVTYHDACKARQGQGLVQEPRRILTGAGVDLRELPEADQCCGGGGTYSFTQPAISQSVGARKIDRILSTGAAVVLTSSVSCLLQLRAGLRRAGSRVRALHIASFFSPDRPVPPGSAGDL